MEFSDIRSVSNVVKFFEAFVVVILLSWSTTRLSFAVKLSVDYLREFSLFLSSTPSVFLIGNVIIIALVAKFPSQEAASSDDDKDTDLYDEFVGDSRRKIDGTQENLRTDDAEAEENKQIVCTVRQVTNAITPFTSNCPVQPVKTITGTGNYPVRPDQNPVQLFKEKVPLPVRLASKERVTYRRSKSETFAGESCDDFLKLGRRKELRRTATENGERGGGGEAFERVVEDLSNDEFRRTVEEFIAKQKSFLREEIVWSNRNAV